MFKLLNSNRGMALPLVLVTIVIFVMFSTAILGMGTVDTKGAVQDSYKAQAYYYAHSGADAVASYIVENPDNLSAKEMNDLVDSLIANGDSDPFSLSPSDGGSIVVNVSRSGNIISVRSEATYQGVKATATLNLNESISAGVPLDKAIYSRKQLDIYDGARIEGDIAGLSNINFHNDGYIDGKVYIHPNATPAVVTHPSWYSPAVENLTEVFDYPDFPFPDYPKYPTGLATIQQTLNVSGNGEVKQITGSVYYYNGIHVSGGSLQIVRGDQNMKIRTKYLKVSNERNIADISSGKGSLEIYVDDYLELSSNSTISFNLGDGDIIIRAKRLLLPQGHILVKHSGKGKLYIYVDDVLQIDGDSSINATQKYGSLGDPMKAFLYYAGTVDHYGNNITDGNNYNNFLLFPNNIKIAATIYIKTAQVHVANGTGIVGNIITGGKKIKFSGGTNTDVKMVYAPNAHVELSGGAGIKGIIVCDSFRMEGGTTVEYKPLDDEYKDMFENAIGKTEYTYGNWQ